MVERVNERTNEQTKTKRADEVDRWLDGREGQRDGGWRWIEGSRDGYREVEIDGGRNGG